MKTHDNITTKAIQLLRDADPNLDEMNSMDNRTEARVEYIN